MQEDQLKTIIKEADIEPDVAMSPSDLSQRVYKLHQTRERRKLIVVSSMLAIFGMIVWIGLSFNRQGEIVKKAPSISHEQLVQTAMIESQDIKKRIEQQELIVRQLIEAESRRRLDDLQKKTSFRVDQRPMLDMQVGRAAASILICADFRAQQKEGVPQARHDYNQVIQIFPNTIWASQAKNRLATLDP